MHTRPLVAKPGPGQESVWDYPRPPRLERVAEPLRVDFAGETIAATDRGYRVLETSHPPVYYFPPSDVQHQFLTSDPGYTLCEFKGSACYWNIEVRGRVSSRAAWSYPAPAGPFLDIKEFFAFYAARVDSCWVGTERVQSQDGGFYGGWITSRIVGPFKGPDGTLGW